METERDTTMMNGIGSRSASGSESAPTEQNGALAVCVEEKRSSPQLPLDTTVASSASSSSRVQVDRSWQFCRQPRKCITDESTLTRWINSESAESIRGFILSLGQKLVEKQQGQRTPSGARGNEENTKVDDRECNERDKGAETMSSCCKSPNMGGTVERLVDALSEMSLWIDSIPPAKQAMRYGNTAFREWHMKLQVNAVTITSNIIQAGISTKLRTSQSSEDVEMGCDDEQSPFDVHAAAQEISTYLADAFGNETRIDYGTGHELAFVAFLYCIARLGLFNLDTEGVILVEKVFVKYLDITRKLQMTYFLEPAGSHGVWGLDDYCFLPFVWGAAQLVTHKYMRPKSIHNYEILEMYSKEYLYYDAVSFVQSVKRGSIFETSPMLCDIAKMKTWDRVYNSLLRMYDKEVLGKRPIMQHFYFGSLIPFPTS